MIFGATPWLNGLLTWLAKFKINLLVSMVFCFFAMYMLLCCEKGNLKFGLRVPYMFKIHPMIVKETF